MRGLGVELDHAFRALVSTATTRRLGEGAAPSWVGVHGDSLYCGDASPRIEWEAECGPDSRVSFLLIGPTRLNATVACDDMEITFGALAPGTHTYVAEHADSSVGFEGDPVEVEGDVVVRPIDLMPLD